MSDTKDLATWPRYAHQRNKFSCGPVAILNSLKWAGCRAAYREVIPSLCQLCECVRPKGTYHDPFDRALRAVAKPAGMHVRRVFHPKLAEVENHLEEGGAVILNYVYRPRIGRDWRHFILMVDIGQGGKHFLLVNDHKTGPPAQWVTRRELKRINFRFQRTDRSFKGWFLSIEE